MNTSFFFSCSFMYNLYSTSAMITCKNVSIFIYYSAYFAFLHLNASHVKVRNTFHFLLSISHIIIIIIASIISKPYDCYYPCTRVLWEYSNVFIHRTYKRIYSKEEYTQSDRNGEYGSILYRSTNASRCLYTLRSILYS